MGALAPASAYGSGSVVIISPNPTLDNIYCDLEGEIHVKSFYRRITIRSGGSGINVARALKCLGVPTTIFTILGGRAGGIAEEILREEGLQAQVLRSSHETRSTSLEYRGAGKRMAVSPAPSFMGKAVEALALAYAPALEQASAVFFGGSFPAPPEKQDLLLAPLVSIRSRLFVDTRGSILTKFLAILPLCLKVDVTDLPELSSAALQDIVHHLHEQGVSLICTENSRELYATFDHAMHIYPQFGEPFSRPFGRGDAFMAGLIFGFLQGYDHDLTVRAALIAGASPGPCTEGLGSINTEAFWHRMSAFNRLAPREAR